MCFAFCLIEPLPCPTGAEFLGDLHQYDPVVAAWTDLSAAFTGALPSARRGQGFTLAGARLYLHGGQADTGVKGGLRPLRGEEV